MQVNTEILKNGLGSMKLTIEASDYREAVDKELKNLKKKAQLKGFRQGMVPMSVVKKMYGKSVLSDQLNKVLEESLNDFLKNTEWELLASPVMSSNNMNALELNKDKEYNFEFEAALKPTIEIPALNDTEMVFDDYEIVVGDKLLDEEIERIQKQHGTTEEVENDIDEPDSLEVVLAELDEEGNVKEGGVESTTWISADMLKEEGPQESLLALKKGDHLDLDVFEAFDKEAGQISSIVLNLTADEEGNYPETSGKFRMTIKTVKRLTKAEITRDLYLTVFGLQDNTVEESTDEETAIVNPSDDIPAEVSVEFFRGKIQESLSAQYRERTNAKLWVDVKKHIQETTKVELAEDILRKMWFFNNSENEKIEDKEAAYTQYIEDLRWRVVVGELAAHFGTEIEDNEIISGTVREVSNMFRMYMGGQAVPDDMLKQLVEARLKDEEYVRSMGQQITEQKLNLQLKESLALNTTQLSVDEYNEMLQKENEAPQLETVEEEGDSTDSESEAIEEDVVVVDSE
ncbi:MAG: trigger factor [Chitinophagales bacterium]